MHGGSAQLAAAQAAGARGVIDIAVQLMPSQRRMLARSNHFPTHIAALDVQMPYGPAVQVIEGLHIKERQTKQLQAPVS